MWCSHQEKRKEFAKKDVIVHTIPFNNIDPGVPPTQSQWYNDSLYE